MGGDIGAGVGQGRDRSDGLHRGILGADRRGGIVINRRQCEVPGGAESQALRGLRPVADGGEHLWPGQHQLDRTAGDPRRERGQDHVRPDNQPGAEPAAQVRDENTDVVFREAEHGGEHVPGHHRPLSAVVDHEPPAVPAGHGGEQPDRVVHLRRGGERLVVGHCGGGQRGGDIAAFSFQPWIADDRGSRVADAEHGLGPLVVDRDEAGRGDGLLGRVRDDDRHVLAVVDNAVLPQRDPGRRAQRRGRRVG
jgi:hypothetical protein